MKKSNRRQTNRQKLQALDWTDEAIEEYSNANSNLNKINVTVEAENGNDSTINDMESKIARVQRRKKEVEDRKLKQSLTKKISKKVDSVLTQFQKQLKTLDWDLHTATTLADKLNVFFRDFLAENPTVLTLLEANYPLNHYDSSVYNEMLPINFEFPCFGACLMVTENEPEASPLEKGLGSWVPCKMLKVEDGIFQVEISSLRFDDIQYLDRMHVLALGQSLDLYSERLVDALKRRRNAVSLLKYQSYIRRMPVNLLVTSSLTNKKREQIYIRSASSKSLLSLEMTVANDEIDEAQNEYEMIMNRLLFNANLRSLTNISFMKSLQFPIAVHLLSDEKKVPYCAVFPVPPYNVKNRIMNHKSQSYIGSTAAISALQGLLQENYNVKDFQVIRIEYKTSFILEKFERYLSEQLLSTMRVIKQEWPNKAGAIIRTSINGAQEALVKSGEPIGCIMYEIGLRNVYEFQKTLNPIKNLLERVNYMMSDLLQAIMRSSLEAFANFVEELCACEVVVLDVRQIQVNMPSDCIYKRKVLPPLFSIAFRIAAQEKVLNQEELDANKADIARWMKTKEAENGDKCPIAMVKPIMGRSFEYSNPLDDFKQAFIKAFNQILNELSEVPHIQKYVMDKVYFPNPRYIASVPSESPLIQQLRQRIIVAIDRATDPLKTYLKFFKKYETFVNIDNQAYINSRIQVTKKDADSQEIELPVSVQLNQLISVIEEHLEQIADIEKSLPIVPIDCGLFMVEVLSVRQLLLDKHRTIIKSILAAHVERCGTIGHYLEDEFRKINKNLSKRPENIEQMVELEEYVSGLPNTMNSLQALIEDMMSYYDVLDKFKYRSDFELGANLWMVYGFPAKILTKCTEVQGSNVAIKRRYHDDLITEQGAFAKSLHDLQSQVTSLEDLKDLAEVNKIAARVKEVEVQLQDAQAKAKLFNSRESLFEQDITDYEDLNKILKNFEPYSNLWQTAKDWIELSEKWRRGRFVDLVPDEVEKNVDKFNIAITKAAKFFGKTDMKQQSAIANKLKAQITEFLPEVPMIVTLRNPGMRDRHWEKIADTLKVNLMPIEDFSTAQIIEMNLKESLDLIQKIGESAAKEFQIEKALEKMEKEWENMNLQLHSYRETGTAVLKGVDDINVILDEQITMTQTIMFSAFKGPFEARIEEWNRKLCCVSDVLEVWVAVQRNWLYLQPIFESPDINRQLPTEGKKFSTVDKSWRQTITAAKTKLKVIEFCDNTKLLERFKESEILLDQVQKGLSDYLETKRSVFARFYFLSNDELLSILSESKDVKLVQPHLKKCFEGIDKVRFLSDLSIDRIISPEGEEVMLTTKIDPVEKNVEAWMLELEAMMRISIQELMGRAIMDYTKTPRATWMQKWAGMCVLNGSQMHWTKEMEELFLSDGSKGPVIMFDRQVLQLADMTVLVRGKLSSAARVTVGALTVIDVHARDVIKKLVDDNVDTKDNFGWTSQLRYYWEEGDLKAQMVAASRPYGYEYLGNTFRLVITPLTDKCYLTLMGALQMIFGGAPAGPAGTGKTETTKDLAKALAMQCVVFNCSDGLDYVAMGKFFKGLAACGAWACFDEFNRINIEVLSVIGQQIMSIQMKIRAKESRMVFEGSDIFVSDRFAVFITMNPGYAGRSALPDSLQALFRPVAMMVPDYALIGEIMFFAYGFEYAKECGAKMVTTFKLCSEQLSAQPHYDYGMRAVKTVITAAGNLKRNEPDADEMVLLLRALQDVNIPKFLEMDLPLFEGIISDLFPGKKRPDLDYGALMRTMKEQIHKFGLQPAKFFITKVIQLYEMIIVRHGLMLVGPTGGGKSSNLHVLEETLGSLKQQGVTGFAYEHVKIYQLNPKSITMGQMYGEFDPNTMEWRDGIMSTMYRAATVDGPDRKWIMFDGPVDAIWIENMNTVLDDNKKLCLNSGEIIKMSNEMTMMFEVEDLTVASPATVSRVGIIYMEPKGLGLDPLIQSWLDRMPECTPTLVKSKLTYYFDTYLQPSITFLRTFLKELVPTVDNNLAASLMRILDCYLESYEIVEGRPAPTDLMIADLVTCIEPLFIFALIWSIGATTNEDGRKMYDAFLRQELICNKMQFQFPKGGMIYDYLFSMFDKKWIKWMEIIDKYEIDNKLTFSEIIVPTTDSIRNTYLLDLLLPCDQHVLMVGATGTGKTINVNQYLMGAAKVQGRVVRSNVIPITMTFSANTSANMTQDLLDSKMDKRRKGVYGPAAGKKFYVYVDDLNMPKREEYGAQPPIELLRQWFDQGGWYDRKDLSFRKLIDLTFVASMGPPGGGRQEITARFLRHFNIIGYVEMSDASKALIFGTILKNFLTGFEGGIVSMTEDIVSASIEVFATIARDLLPTPSKSHYTFNLRDLAKVFQGMLMVDPKKMNSKVQLARLWVHENKRVFADRLTCEEDHEWLKSLLANQVERKFAMKYHEVVPNERLVFGDFITGSEIKLYEEIDSMDRLKLVVEEYLSNHNMESKQPMPLVMFSDALEHVARIARILRQPQGNALLLGVGGSGRQSMTKLATYIAGFQLAMVEIVKGYSMNDWREDIKRILMQAGVKDKPTTFLFSDVQIINERMVEDINNILNAGDVPNLYAAEDMENIASVCRVECQKKKIPPTKLNIFAQYIIRVRKNIHLCVAMSPIGEAFRNRLRNFPSLVNCCTIDWFTNWPAEALQSVGLSMLRSSDLGLGEYEAQTVSMFKKVHISVEEASKVYYEMLRRRNYVTPTSFLELLSSFGKLIAKKRLETSVKRDRLQIGLDKLSETKKMVGVMQEELVVLQPVLVKTQGEVASMMVAITRDKASAAETKAKVEVEEAKTNEKAAESKAIADDAQRDLAEAIPALEEAVKCLNDLKKSDIDEVKSLKTPPGGVVLTIKVCCLMFEVKPIKKNDPNNPGKKIDDYWEAGQKGLLTDAKVFINSLFSFDKDNIPDRIVKSIAPFMDDPNFTPAAIERSSKACTAICMWARAMYKYHFVALGVAPKRARLKEAEAELEIVMAQLATAKATLKQVNDRLAQLETAYNEAVEKKDMLEKKEASCKIQLSNADKLIGGLGGEEARWHETVELLKDAYVNILGDVIVSAATISYLGPFTAEFRNNLVAAWQEGLRSFGIPHSTGCNLESTLADPVKVRAWQICLLPSDSLSTQNAIIMENGRRWPLLIDPQGQANRYIRAMAKDNSFAVNGMDVVKLSDKNFLRTLENGVQFGRWVLLENILESLDAALEPILLQQKFKQGGQEMMKIGDNIIPYNDTFRFFMTTKLSNPHYAPEVQVKVSLLNFTITLGGLEEQLLGVVVAEELPELSQQKANLVVQNAQMNKQLYDIESEILYLLSNSKGNILDDTVLIETLAQSKKTSEEIKDKMKEASQIEKEIQVQSELYRPVAKRASLLYFVIADLGTVDPMYQYSLPWFTQLFVRGIGAAKPASSLDHRIINLNDYFTFSVYNNICRSLFERHKLLFSFILCVKILQGENQIDGVQYRFLLSGISPEHIDALLPHTSWLEPNVWSDICDLAGIPRFHALIESFSNHTARWQQVFDSSEPHKMKFPEPYHDSITPLERLCVLRCLRRDKIELGMQDFIIKYLGEKFIQPPPFDLKACYLDSVTITPLIFVLSSGSDPNKELDILAQDMNMTDRLKRIALGQGQGKKASTLIEKGVAAGDWVMLQNCHLSISWMPILEQICESMEADKIHPEFRLWLTSMPSESFPTSVLQNGVKITKEPPKGLRANLKSTFMKLDNTKLKKTNKPKEFQKLLFGLSFYHAIVIERKKFGPLGWNIPYEFNDTDMDITAAQLELYVSSYADIPFKVLQQLTSVVNYGGRITDDKDMRTSDILIADFFQPKILDHDYNFSVSGLYYSFTPDIDAPHQSYLDYIEQLPFNAEPEVFGMHDNANITCAITEADSTFGIILTLQPRVAGGGGISREDQIIEMAKQMALQLQPLYDIEAVGMLYPTDYHESMNTVLVQEAQRYNRLLHAMHVSLKDLQRALKGLVVLSAELEAMGNACFDQRVPASWTAAAYPSLKPLGSWFKDLLQRLHFLTSWIDIGLPSSFWISGFFFPQGFLTAILQNYARKYRYPIDTVSFSFVMMEESAEELVNKPEDGSYIYGLFIEGARWDKRINSLVDPKPKELFAPLPTVHMLPQRDRATPSSGIYRCPVYKILTRTGTLSTTGHSTNFVTWIEIPSDKPTIWRSSLVSETNAQIKFCDQDYWIKAGVACFCALRY